MPSGRLRHNSALLGSQMLSYAGFGTQTLPRDGFGSKRHWKERKRTEENKREQPPNDRAVAGAQGRYLVPRWLNGPRTIEVVKTEEKVSDVSLAAYLLLAACEKDFDTAVVNIERRGPQRGAAYDAGPSQGQSWRHQPSYSREPQQRACAICGLLQSVEVDCPSQGTVPAGIDRPPLDFPQATALVDRPLRHPLVVRRHRGQLGQAPERRQRESGGAPAQMNSGRAPWDRSSRALSLTRLRNLGRERLPFPLSLETSNGNSGAIVNFRRPQRLTFGLGRFWRCPSLGVGPRGSAIRAGR